VNEQPASQTNGWASASLSITEEYTVEGATVGDVNLTGLLLYDWLGWVVAKSLASETAQLIVGGTTTNISLTSTPTCFFAAKGSTAYPAGGTDVGLVTSGVTSTTVSLYDCGVVVAYNPTAPPPPLVDGPRGDRRPFPFTPGSAPQRM
jgi:hypothetical protein